MASFCIVFALIACYYVRSLAASKTRSCTLIKPAFVLFTRLVGLFKIDTVHNRALVLVRPLYKFKGLNIPRQYGKQAGQYKKFDVPDSLNWSEGYWSSTKKDADSPTVGHPLHTEDAASPTVGHPHKGCCFIDCRSSTQRM